MKGRVTIPTDRNFIEGTKEIMEKWGADAVRDCDGTELPEHPSELSDKVYKTYFLVRGNNAWAYQHYEALQNVALISKRVVAETNQVKIPLTETYFTEQIAVNDDEESKKYWQVIDRTSGQEITKYYYDPSDRSVSFDTAKRGHEYTVSYFAKALWDPTQIYNYLTNHWTIQKDRDIDPIFDDASKQITSDLENWLKANPEITVIRFTTFFYHFFLINNEKAQPKYFDWFGYAMSASPAMFQAFEKKKGYSLKIEDIVDEGYYANDFRIPTKQYLDYIDFVSEFVAEKMRGFIDVVHRYNREAMMFLGDNWIGAEPYGKYFPRMNLDAVVGSVNSGATTRMLADIPGVKYHEIRLLPYFFPDALKDDDELEKRVVDGWVIERRAIMRKPVDRIGFGGYLSLANKFPKFVNAIANICEEFRTIYSVLDGKDGYNAVSVAIMSAWGKERTWMSQMICQDAPYQKIRSQQGLIEALVGLPVKVDFISFDDAKNGALKNYDVVINYGVAGTAFSGGELWQDEKLTECVNDYILSGGGFFGMGEPSATQYGGRYFQLASALGVDEERGFSLIEFKRNFEKEKEHFILEDVSSPIDYGTPINNIYALKGTKILDIEADKYMGLDVDAGHVRMAVNTFGKGRSFYVTGLEYNAENTRLIYRALLWCAHKESELKKCFSSNVFTECNYYPESKKYAIVNNTSEKQKTEFYDRNGIKKELTVGPSEILWIQE